LKIVVIIEKEGEMCLNRCRKDGKKALRTVVKRGNNVKIIEKEIYKQTYLSLEKKTEEDFEHAYADNIFQTVQDILSGMGLSELYSNLKAGNIGRKHQCFSEISSKIDEADDFIDGGIVVEESIQTCRKCGSKRVLTSTKQTRSSDEPESLISRCNSCGNKWIYSG
jgi:DNA-directed RNA polymerase subunit M/transcription elongation factor TFIIS